jgi:hypothetical protein
MICWLWELAHKTAVGMGAAKQEFDDTNLRPTEPLFRRSNGRS